MTAVTYTASRSIATGHSLGVSYDLDLSPMVLQPVDKPIYHEEVSIAGNTQVAVEREDELFDVELLQLLVGTQEYENVLEFLKSVNLKETFIFDAYGSVASPDDPRTAILTGPFSRPRIGPNPEFKFSFQVRLLP
jgi:hypothetical protein